MIPFQRDAQQTISENAVTIIGVGGAGGNMIDRVAIDGMDGAELVVVNTDIRALSTNMAPVKVQIGKDLTRGLGSGGDPEMGRNAVKEAENDIRAAIKGRKIVFICVGLGGGTGSGASPTIARIAREEGAFTVVFATMPFSFEGQRRRDQASTALNELAVISNALVTFDNGRMGELVLAKQGIHEAFGAADRLISESIKAVTRLVVRPGLINVGLDDLMTALKTTKSRCLFGSGLGTGDSRSQHALNNALSSPLLDRGSLLRDAQSVLVHICGGEDMTLYEIELLMQGLAKHVPASAHILFGAAVDPKMKNALSVTLISSLPEDRLHETAASSSAELPPLEVTEAPKLASVAAEEPLEMEESPMEEPADVIENLSDDQDESEFFDELMEDHDHSEPAEELAVEEEMDESEISEEPSDVVEEEQIIDEAPEFSEAPKSVAVEERESTKSKIPQTELALDGGPKGKFDGAEPNLFGGEDLDIPPFLRNKRK